MASDVITIKIKIKNENLTMDEKTDLIVSDLEGLIALIEANEGNVQQLKGQSVDSSVEYVHLRKD